MDVGGPRAPGSAIQIVGLRFSEVRIVLLAWEDRNRKSLRDGPDISNDRKPDIFIRRLHTRAPAHAAPILDAFFELPWLDTSVADGRLGGGWAGDPRAWVATPPARFER